MSTSFNRKAKRFVRSVINQRQRLIDMDRSYKNKAEMLRTIDRLRTQLNAYPYTSDKAISHFLIGFRAEIFALIPGGTNESRKNEFKELLSQSYNIVKPKAGSHHTVGAR